MKLSRRVVARETHGTVEKLHHTSRALRLGPKSARTTTEAQFVFISIIVFTIANLIYLIRDARSEIPPHIRSSRLCDGWLTFAHVLVLGLSRRSSAQKKNRLATECVCDWTRRAEKKERRKILIFLHGMISDINIVSKKYVRALETREKEVYFSSTLCVPLPLSVFRVMVTLSWWWRWWGQWGVNSSHRIWINCWQLSHVLSSRELSYSSTNRRRS